MNTRGFARWNMNKVGKCVLLTVAYQISNCASFGLLCLLPAFYKNGLRVYNVETA